MIIPKNVNDKVEQFLPTPKVSPDKVVPPTVYTTMNFDTRSSVVSSQWLDNGAKSTTPPSDAMAPANLKLVPTKNNTDYDYDADEEEHLPAGQHLLIDIDGVDGQFLNSEKQLATAMLDMVDTSGLTLLSYHCHGLLPSGVTCVGVLLESHVSFHTWPEEGVITLDLFTCGSTSLLNHLQLIQKLFAIPRQGVPNPETPRVLWAYKRRGFREQTANVGSRDTFAYPLGIHGIEQKNEVAATTTDQGKRALVYDIQRSIKGTQYSDSPSRYFYLDGVLKASSDSGPASYESFVHPAMFAHPDPKRILMVGTTTGAAIKEILKHKSVEEVSVVGVDESLLSFAKQSLRDWNDCSDIVSIADSCLEDTRIKSIYENPKMWLHNYHAMSLDKNPSLYDIILVDFLDMEEEVARDLLTGIPDFLHGLQSVLNSGGVLAFNAGSDFRAVDSKTTLHSTASKDSTTQEEILKNLGTAGFVHLKQYNENLAGYPNPRNFIVAFSDDTTASYWNRNEAQINRLIRDRAVNTKSGLNPFNFFDGSKMVSYSRFEQDVANCESHPNPRWCDINRQLRAAKPNMGQLPTVLDRLDHDVEVQGSSDINASDDGVSQCRDKPPALDSRWSSRHYQGRKHFLGAYKS